ncbi:aminotransferase class IV [Streptosporangiaceae bacterium NEAU-GS5]|nr:aminotransferase class IV [Streptosporangiaceae bacterium NEAU-GS5]
METQHAEIDGRPPTTEELLAAGGYGHFTAMQVRGRRLRGLDLHLRRLDTANRELFDRPLDPERVRLAIRSALDSARDTARDTARHVAQESALGRGDASVRVNVFDGEKILVRVGPPAPPPGKPARVRTVDDARFLPHVKTTGGFIQAYYARLADRDGYDEALFARDGVISEGLITNVAFIGGGGEIVWPDAPALDGITMLLLRRALPYERRRITVADVASYRSAALTNSHGVRIVDSIGDVPFAPDDTLVKTYENIEWDEI